MRRVILGIIALLMIGGGGAMYFGAWGGLEQAGGMFFKAGLGLGAIWLAMPQLDDLFSSAKGLWLIVIVIAVGILLFYPRMAFVLVPIFLVLAGIQFVSWLFTPLSDAAKGSVKKGPADRQVVDVERKNSEQKA